MPTKQYSVSIKSTKDGSYLLKKDDNLMHMLGIGYGFHKKLLEVASKSEGKIYEDGKNFTDLIEKLSVAGKTVTINNDEALILREWINCICQILIETSGVSVEDENIKKFFRVSESFVKKTNPDKATRKKKQKIRK
jgi:hypothetical protein